MPMYIRPDGVMCDAEQFTGVEELTEEGLQQQLFMLRLHGIKDSRHRLPTATDEWFENEDGEPEERIIPERIEIWALIRDEDGNLIEVQQDQAVVGDWFVKRDGTAYVMQQDLFESIWTPVSMEGIG